MQNLTPDTRNLKPFIAFAGWVIDGTGGPIRQNVLMKVENGLITALDSFEDRPLAGKRILDFSACTLLPTLVDAHVHLFMSGSGDPGLRERQLDAPFEGMQPIISTHVQQHLAHGVLAVRDGGDYAGHTLRYKHECLLASGSPLIVKSSGRAWRAEGRYGRLIGRPARRGTTLAHGITHSREDIDQVKIVNSGLNSLTEFGREGRPQFALNELKDAVEAGRLRGLPTMVHANGKEPVRVAVEAGCHSVEHGFFMGEENLRRMAERGVVWVPTAFTMEAYSRQLPPGSLEADVARRNLESQLEWISRARECGVIIAVGTDAGSLGVHHGSSVRDEIRLFMEAGFSLQEAIQCATANGARLLRLEDELGRLTPGMPANFLVIPSSPASLPDSLGLVERIYIRGRAWSADEEVGSENRAINSIS